jgi:TonB family protein
MAMRRSFISATALIMFASSLIAQQPKYSPTPPIVQFPPGTKRAKAVALYAPKPEYPEYAKKRHWVGVGWYLMHVDVKTGTVASVEVTQSTGHKMLDEVCVNVLSRWRFKPGTAAPKVKVPITFATPVENKSS